jgi:hypothetical protein
MATTAKRLHTTANEESNTPSSPEEDCIMDDVLITQPTFNATVPPQPQPMRPTTPPLGMTLAHYDASTGSYTSSQLNSNHEVKSSICTGMTPVYRAPFERWGSCLI